MNRTVRAFGLALSLTAFATVASASELGLKDGEEVFGTYNFETSYDALQFTAALKGYMDNGGVTAIENIFQNYNASLNWTSSAITYIKTADAVSSGQLIFGTNSITYNHTVFAPSPSGGGALITGSSTLGAPGPIAGAGIPAIIALLASAVFLRGRKFA